MSDLKPISHIQFNEFIKGKGFKGKSNYKLKDLKAMFGFKPLYDRRSLVISSKDMEPTESGSVRKAAKAIGVSEGSIRYAEKNGNFKERSHQFNSGVGKCPCGQTFDSASERDMNMKLRMHHKFCFKLAEGFRQIGTPKKATTLREQQLNEAKRKRKVH